MTQTNSTASATTTGSAAFFLFILALLLPTYTFFQMASMNVLSPDILKSFPEASNLATNLTFTYLFTSASLMILAGLLLDRIVLKYLAPVIMLFPIIGLTIMSFSLSLTFLYMGRVIAGMGDAFSFLVAFKIIRLCLPASRRGLGFGAMTAFAMLGGLLAQYPLEILVEATGWQATLLIDVSVGVALLVFGTISLQYLNDDLTGQSSSLPSMSESLAAFFSSRLSLVSAACGISMGFLGVAIILLGSAVGNSYIIKVDHFSPEKASLVISLIFIGTMIGMPFFGWFYDKVGGLLKILKWATFLGLITSIIFLYIHGRSFSLQMIMLLLIAFASAAQSLGYVYISLISPSGEENTLMAIQNFFLVFINSLIPLFFNLFSNLGLPTWLPQGLLVIPVCLILANLILFFLPSVES